VPHAARSSPAGVDIVVPATSSSLEDGALTAAKASEPIPDAHREFVQQWLERRGDDLMGFSPPQRRVLLGVLRGAPEVRRVADGPGPHG
jgi:hypothetical protein